MLKQQRVTSSEVTYKKEKVIPTSPTFHDILQRIKELKSVGGM
jgi:hypothetical protein